MPILLACLLEAVVKPNMIKRIEAWLCPVGQCMYQTCVTEIVFARQIALFI